VAVRVTDNVDDGAADDRARRGFRKGRRQQRLKKACGPRHKVMDQCGGPREAGDAVAGEAGELREAAPALGAAFGDSFVHQVMEFFSGLSRLVISCRVTHVAIMGYLGQWKNKEQRRAIAKCLDVMQKFVLPILKAWSEFAGNEDLDRCAGLLRDLLVAIMNAAKHTCGPVDQGKRIVISSTVFNQISDQLDERILAFSFARLGSCILVSRVVIGRLLGSLSRCYTANVYLRFVPFAHLSDAQVDEFAKLLYADRDLIQTYASSCALQRSSTESRSKYRRLGCALEPLLRIKHRPKPYMCRVIKTLIGIVDDILLFINSNDNAGSPPTATVYEVVNYERFWTDITIPRYSSQRWLDVKITDCERPFIL
jgi:hypothetical protein